MEILLILFKFTATQSNLEACKNCPIPHFWCSESGFCYTLMRLNVNVAFSVAPAQPEQHRPACLFERKQMASLTFLTWTTSFCASYGNCTIRPQITDQRCVLIGCYLSSSGAWITPHECISVCVQLVVSNRGRSDKLSGRLTSHAEFTVHPKIGANYQHISMHLRCENVNRFIIYIHFYFTFVNHFTHEDWAAHTLNFLF